MKLPGASGVSTQEKILLERSSRGRHELEHELERLSVHGDQLLKTYAPNKAKNWASEAMASALRAE